MKQVPFILLQQIVALTEQRHGGNYGILQPQQLKAKIVVK